MAAADAGAVLASVADGAELSVLAGLAEAEGGLPLLAAGAQRAANEPRDAINPLVGRLFAAVNAGAEGLDEARETLQKLAAVVFDEERREAEEMIAGKDVVRENFVVPIPRVL